MPCSAVTLSIATICAIIATALLAIAFSTDNWLHYDVRRNQIQVSVKRQQNDADDSHISRLSHFASSISFAHAHACMYVCISHPRQTKTKTIGSNRAKASAVIEKLSSAQVVLEEEVEEVEGRAEVKEDVKMRRR